MKICHVNFARGFRGGERQTQLLIEALADLDIEQILVARRDSPLHDKLTSIPRLTLVRVRKPYFSAFAHVSRLKPDLVHAHDAKAAQWAYLYYLAARMPYMMTRRMSRPSKNVAFTRAVYRNASGIVALSRAVRESVLKRAPKADVQVIPSMFASLPVDPSRVNELKARYAGQFIVGHIGALVNPHKGQAVLIKATRALTKKHDNLRVLLLGTGKDGDLLKRLAYDLPNVEFVGFVEDVGNWISIFDLFVFPSLEEGLGSSLLDVMQQGKPIVASSVGGILDVIKHGENGLLVPPNDPVYLAEAIEEMVYNRELRERCSETGLKSLEKYSPRHVARCYYAIYRSLVAKRNIE